MKKVFAVCLLFAFCFSLISCAPEPEPTTIEFDWGDSETDELFGKKMKVWQEVRVADDSYILDYRGDSPLGDELRTRIDTLEEKHQCEIELVDSFDYLNYISAVSSGIQLCDVSYIELYDFRNIVNAGLITPVDDYLDVIDVKDSLLWGFPNILERMMCKGTLYGVCPCTWPENLGGFAFVMVCNSGILYKNGFAHPQEYVENGAWTRDKVVDIIIGCYDPNTVTYGLDAYHEYWSRMSLFSNGVKYIVKKNDGSYEYGGKSEAALDGLTWASASRDEMGPAYFQEPTNGNPVFDAGQAAFTLDWGMQALDKYPYMSDITDLSMPPFPSNPRYNKYENWTGYLDVGSSTISVPINAESVHASAQLIYELFQPLAGIRSEEDLFDYYADNVFFSQSDFRNIWTAMKNSEFSYLTDGQIFKIFNDTLHYNEHSTAAEAVEKFGDKAWNELERDVLPNKLAYEKYFGFDYFEQQ